MTSIKPLRDKSWEESVEKMKEIHTVLKEIIAAAKECGQVMLCADRNHFAIQDKAGKANFVTEYDCKIQKLLEAKLAKILPEAEFLGEEEDCQIDRNAEYIFVVDPIDGTTNFIKDYHMSCISIGLIRNGKRYLGVVHNPYLEETFSAISGEGAYLNGNAIHVSGDDLENGIVLFGSSPYNTELAKASFEMAYEYFQKCLDIRRSGSAALDLCAIASGRAEVFFELLLSPWDFAAGALIVEEAGGIVTTVKGEELPCLEKSPLLARNK